jgi:probable HAF family extracellular repeat protein
MLTTRLQLVLLIVFVCSVAVPGQTPPPQYTVTDLGDFSAQALNNSTTVVGSQGNKAVLFRNGVLIDITPVGTWRAVANGINDLDQVVGEVGICDMVEGTCQNSRSRAFIFDRGTKTILGTLGGRDSSAFAINNAGWSHTAGPLPGNVGDEHGFIFQNGVFEDIGLKTTARGSIASSINATGQVAGWASSTTPESGAFLFSGGAFQFFAPNALAWDINNAGQIVGGISGNDDGTGRAFLFSGGTLQDLGMPSQQHRFARAFAINNAGEVVGFSSPAFLSDGERAFVFRNGTIQDLNNLIPANSGWVLSKAEDINDAGQIVGIGFKDGQPRAFLLTPTQPLLLTEPNSSRAVVIESVSFVRDPFSLQRRDPIGPDRRTRLTIVARNIEIIAAENTAPLTVQAENAQHQLIDLPVEFIGRIPGADWLTQITLRLPDQLNTTGDIHVRISFRGQTSNAGSITMAANP